MEAYIEPTEEEFYAEIMSEDLKPQLFSEQHTPGPWKVEYDGDSDDYNSWSWPYRIVNTTLPAEPPCQYDNVFKVVEFQDGMISEPDAHLMAAAPKLLAALRMFVEAESGPAEALEAAKLAILEATHRTY